MMRNHMKRITALLLGITFTLLPVALSSGAEPGQVDFGNFTPPKAGGEFVEVNIPPNLIALAAKFVEKQEPDVAKLLAGIKQVRVNVVGLDEDNREDFQKKAQRVRSDLSGKGWERIVTAQKD